MNVILKIILSLSISGSLLILILLLGKPLFKDRMSKGWQYYIWLVVIARLLLPFAPEVNLMGSLFGQMEDRIKYENYLQSTVQAVSHGMSDSKAEGRSTLENDTEARVNWMDGQDADSNIRYILQNLWLIWLGAALLFFIRKITLYQSFSKYIKAGWQEVADVALLDRMSDIELQMGIKKPVELCTNSLISSPLLLGFFHPCIVLPTVDLPEEDFGYIIWHELFHYKRGDMFYKWVVQIALCLHWFNPLVYLMEREIGRACELACDEAVMGMLDDSGRRAYGDTLLHAMGTGGGYKDSLATLTLNESAKLLKERLGEIMKFKTISRKMRLCSLLLVSVFVAGAAVMGAYASPAGQLRFDGTDLMVSRKEILSMEDSGIGFVESAVKGDSSSSFRYTQESYYQAPYLFEIGWNVRENAGDFYAGTELPLDDGSRMEVFYTDKCSDIWEDSSAVNALTLMLTRLKCENAETEFPLTRPLVVRVQNIGYADLLVLAEEYYQNKEIAQYVTAFAMLTEEEQNGLLQKSYQDDQITFFSAGVGQLDVDSKLIKRYAEKAYADSKINFFSVLANRMSQEALEEWIKRAVADDRSNFRAILYHAAGREDEKEAMEEELDARRLEEYWAHGITGESRTYYYQGEMVRILMDARPNSSFIYLEQNPRGTVDIRIIRDENEVIQNVRYMTEEEKEELFGSEEDWDSDAELYDDLKDTAVETKVSRLKIEELPESVREAMQNCAIRTWYLICDGGEQYIFYNGFAWEYAYEPERLEDGWKLRIEPLRKKDSGYLLIWLSDEAPVTVICDGAEVLLKKVEIPVENGNHTGI